MHIGGLMRSAWMGKRWKERGEREGGRERRADRKGRRKVGGSKEGGGEEDEVEEENFMGYQIKSLSQAYSSIQPSFANKHSIVLATLPDLTNLHSWQGLTGCLQRGKLSNINLQC